jgi:hypothetical protein
MPPSEQKTCFLIALPGSQLDVVRRQLQKNNVACLSLDRTIPSAANATSVKSILKRSDFVTCILPLSPPPNLIFELGVAMGLGKPILLFAEDPVKVPIDLAWSRALNSDLISTEALNTFLEAFIRTVPESPTKTLTIPKRTSSQRISFWQGLKSEASRIPTLGAEVADSKMEALIERAFQSSGFNLTSSPGRDFGADFALVSPGVIDNFGLPILVEVKNNSQSAVRQNDVDRLLKLLSERRGAAGLIVTFKRHGSPGSLHLPKPIVIVPVEELLGWLEAGSFVDEMVSTTQMFWNPE